MRTNLEVSEMHLNTFKDSNMPAFRFVRQLTLTVKPRIRSQALLDVMPHLSPVLTAPAPGMMARLSFSFTLTSAVADPLPA